MINYLDRLIAHAKETYPQYEKLELKELIEALSHDQHIYAYSLSCQLTEAHRINHTSELRDIK